MSYAYMTEGKLPLLSFHNAKLNAYEKAFSFLYNYGVLPHTKESFLGRSKLPYDQGKDDK